MDDKISLLDKKANDLTVGDTLKITVVTTVIVVAVPIAIGCGFAVADKIKAKIAQRKLNNTDLTITPDE